MRSCWSLLHMPLLYAASAVSYFTTSPLLIFILPLRQSEAWFEKLIYYCVRAELNLFLAVLHWSCCLWCLISSSVNSSSCQLPASERRTAPATRCEEWVHFWAARDLPQQWWSQQMRFPLVVSACFTSRHRFEFHSLLLSKHVFTTPATILISHDSDGFVGCI